ncbi:MAG: hypothetical protein CFE27_15760 [Alphaproteobacteria bacterium PA1]|nr:MAG: hypothetical protein CFE27_15760 [Alphaproteobacteria bacterium PA1]
MKKKPAIAQFRKPLKTARLFLPPVGVAVLLLIGCSRTSDQIYIHRSYFLNSGNETIGNPAIRQPYLDWVRDPEDQFRTIQPPKQVAQYIISLREFPYFSEKVRSKFPARSESDVISLKVVAPAIVMKELPPILLARQKGKQHSRFSLCSKCNRKPDIVIVTLCAYGQSPCFGSFSYDQYGQSGLRTGEIQNGVSIIRGPNSAFPKIDYFCPSGALVSLGGPIDFGSSRIPWFEFPEELSIQLMTGFTTFEFQRGDNDWNDAMSKVRVQANGSDTPLAYDSNSASVLSIFEGRDLSCRSKRAPATVERFMTLAIPFLKQPQRPRVCIVSGHEHSPKIQAELIARCAEFGTNPMLEINQSHQK